MGRGSAQWVHLPLGHPARRGNTCHAVTNGTDLWGIPFQALRAWLRSFGPYGTGLPGPKNAQTPDRAGQSPFCPEQNAALHFLLNILEIAGITIAKNRGDERVSTSVACNEILFVSGAFNIRQ